MPDDVSDRLAALERRLDRLEAILLPRPSAVTPPPVVPPRPLPVPPPASTPTAPRPTLEQAIGLRVAGAVGAVVLVIGAGLAIDFAYRQGWLDRLPPAGRWAVIVAAAAALIGAGEVVFRRVGAKAAAGVFAAGVAVLFLAAYAGFAFYGLYGVGPAYALMAAATIVGAAVARRGDTVWVAAVAILGGNVAPLLLHAGPPRPVPFLSYLLMLELVAVALAYVGGRAWWPLRALSLATTAVWVATVVGLPTFAGGTTAGFLIGYAVLFHAERIASAGRAGDAGSVPFGVAVTAALAAGLLYLARDATATVRTAEVLAMAAVAAGVAAACRRRPALAGGFVVQAAGLVVLAVPVATSGPWVVLGWAVLAVAVSVGGRWAPAARPAGPIVWALAAVDLLLWADGWAGTGDAQHVWLTVAGSPVPAFVVMAAVVAAAGHVVAMVTRRLERLTDAATAVDVGAAVVLVVAAAVGLRPTVATTVALGYAAVALTAAPVAVGTAVAVVATVKWMAIDTVIRRPADGSTWPTAAVGAAAVAVLAAAGRANRGANERVRRALRVFSVWTGVWAGSVAVDAAFATVGGGRLAEDVALSALWAAAALATVVAGFGRRLPDLRYAGLALFAVTLVKVVLVDLAGVGAGWRVLSFVGLGGLLLATSVLYGRVGGEPRSTAKRTT